MTNYKVLPEVPTDEMIENVTWYVTGENRGQPVWRFDHLGHTGEVAFGGDTKYSAKLDNSGTFGIETADEAKTLAVSWLKNRVKDNLARATKWIKQYQASPQFECEPLGEMRCDATTGHIYGVYWYGVAPSIGTKVYTIPQDQSKRIAELEAENKTLLNRIHEITTDWIVMKERLNVAEDALEALSYQSEDILNTTQSVMISANYVKKISDEALNKIRGEK